MFARCGWVLIHVIDGIRKLLRIKKGYNQFTCNSGVTQSVNVLSTPLADHLSATILVEMLEIVHAVIVSSNCVVSVIHFFTIFLCRTQTHHKSQSDTIRPKHASYDNGSMCGNIPNSHRFDAIGPLPSIRRVHCWLFPIRQWQRKLRDRWVGMVLLYFFWLSHAEAIVTVAAYKSTRHNSRVSGNVRLYPWGGGVVILIMLPNNQLGCYQ